MTLGTQWKNSFIQNPLSSAESAGRDDLLTSVAEYEAKAKDYLHKIKTDLLPKGIASCVARQTASCGIEVPAGVLTTHAFSEFRSELLKEGIIFSAGIVRDNQTQTDVCLCFTYQA